jgi:hypothetical protein
MAGRTSKDAPGSKKEAPKIKNPERLKDPKYALALHIARARRERRGGKAPLPMR